MENQMEMNQTSNRIHPLMAGAAVSVMLVSLLGVAALTGVLPNSHAAATETPRVAALASPVEILSTPQSTPAQQGAVRKTVAHHHPAVQVQERDQAQTRQQPAPAPVYQQPAPVAHNSPIGIGIGAVVGGLLGNQIGGGEGKTLATIAGAVGGGYVGNEIAKRNQ
jgi:uncharacterized protein YcfJ